MIAIIDTCSLLSLARYYLHFDVNNKLYNYIKNQIQSNNLLVIDAVLEECKYLSQGLIIDKLDFLDNKDFKKETSHPIKTENLLPPSPKRFYNMMGNNFLTPYARRLNEAEFEQAKRDFLISPDARIIIYAQNAIRNNPDVNIVIVTEETVGSNDRKFFRKIPAICDELKIDVITLPQLLETYDGVDFNIN